MILYHVKPFIFNQISKFNDIHNILVLPYYADHYLILKVLYVINSEKFYYVKQ